jgi:diguanylate cyclase
VAEAVDWKQKHLDSLREMEAEEAQWRAVEEVLRRLVRRLCAVATSSDERFNAQLGKLAAATRSNADAIELKALCDSLTDAVWAVEKSAPSAPAPAPQAAVAAPRWDSTRAAVARLLDRLDPLEAAGDALGELRSQLTAADDDPSLSDVLQRTADLVAERAAEIGRERGEAAALLAQVNARLEEMAEYLAGTTEERRQNHDASQSINIEVLEHVAQLSHEVRAGNDLVALRALVAERLESVAANLRNFRARSAQRFVEQSARGERMRARIAELERESRDLSRNLDLEKRRARTDPLTRVANRGSLDERLVEELARWRRFRAPVAVLVWDLDRFKSVNDTFGHRAGDGVLRVVAGCLGIGRRAVDFLARYGGEEFVSLLVGTTLEEATRIANETRTRIAALKVHFRGTPINITVSCGITDLREGDTPESVFDRADAAMYRAKEEGRNRCVAV